MSIKKLCVFLSVVLITGCSLLSSDEEDREKFNPNDFPIVPGTSFELSLDHETVNTSGEEALLLKLMIHNPNPDTLNLLTGGGPVTKGGPTEHYFQFAVTKPDCTLFWDRLPDIQILLALDLILKPGETRTFTHTWNETSNNGLPILKGSYLLFGGLVGVAEIDSLGREHRIGNLGVGATPDTVIIE
ncbi:MAG: hypothetical protein R3211_03440 [Balneolaceae bacterium]|nr:hypothetical protein [Balneolaceae bacterium]